MDLNLTDKVAIVTGSSRGIGRAIARGLLAEGCRVTICGRDRVALEKAAAELKAEAGGQVLPVTADGTNAEDAGRVVEETVRTFGRLEILVNSFGRIPGAGKFMETSEAQ